MYSPFSILLLMADETGGRSGPAASGSVGGTGGAGLIGVETRGTFCVPPS